MDDINFKKEFTIFNVDKNYEDSIFDDEFKKNNKLILNSYQNFISNFMSIHNNFNRLLLFHSTGSGKTITALNVASEYIKTYKMNNMDSGHVIILGFSKRIFKREIIVHPEFGITNEEEAKEYILLKQQLIYGNEEIKNKLKDLDIKYSNRMVNRYFKGKFKFFGYKEFFNKLFDISKININDLKSETILDLIETKKIKVNIDLLYMFENSLIIADEIHNVYNSFENNNWGIAIQYVLDYYSRNKKYLKTLYLSATPINHKPIELISICNLLVEEKDKLDINIQKIDNKLLNKIKELLTNKISFIRDYDPDNYPTYDFKGEKINNIEYLKFIRCDMSSYHFNTYKNLSKIQKEKKDINLENVVKTSTEFIESEIIKNKLSKYKVNLSHSNRYLIDYVLPNPESSNIGLFTQNDIRDSLLNSNNEWKQKNKIEIYEKKEYGFYVSGQFLLKENLKKYSSKYYNLLVYLEDIIKNKSGKIFIFHNYVNNSGIFFINEVLKINGYLDESSSVVSNTRCVNCYKTFKDHKNKDEFEPLRFTYISSEVSKSVNNENIENFNSKNNLRGNKIKIILGAKSLKESITLKAIQHLFITSIPDNISTLIQILGRAIRKFSHNDLSQTEKNVNIYILVSSIKKEEKRYLSFEEYNYKFKIDTYKDIEKINKEIFIRNSLDFYINNKINQYQLDNTKNNLLNNYMTITHKDNKLLNDYNNKLLNIKNINETTFDLYYKKNEINMIKVLIKRCFLEISPYWKHDDLYNQILNFPYNVEFNTKYLNKGSFIIALSQLIYYPSNIFVQNEETNNNVVSSLLNSNSKIFNSFNKNKKTIIFNDEFYIMVNYNERIDYDITNSEILLENIYIPLTDIENKKIIENENEQNFDDLEEEILNKTLKKLKVDDTLFYDYNLEFHIYMIEKIISLSLKKNIIENKYKNLVKYYSDLQILIFKDEVIDILLTIYKDLKNNEIPIGHKLKNDNYFYSINKKEWFIYNNYLKKNIKYTNNEIYGEVKYTNNEYIFIINYNKSTDNIILSDKRTVKTGINCLSIEKAELVEILNHFNINLEKLRKKSICDEILKHLMRMEYENKNKETKIKYLYNVWS